jgi:hypothetical protein
MAHKVESHFGNATARRINLLIADSSDVLFGHIAPISARGDKRGQTGCSAPAHGQLKRRSIHAVTLVHICSSGKEQNCTLVIRHEVQRRPLIEIHAVQVSTSIDETPQCSLVACNRSDMSASFTIGSACFQIDTATGSSRMQRRKTIITIPSVTQLTQHDAAIEQRLDCRGAPRHNWPARPSSAAPALMSIAAIESTLRASDKRSGV